jgi:outer membrane protein OmpA-like peptidoglycan-associated protein
MTARAPMLARGAGPAYTTDPGARTMTQRPLLFVLPVLAVALGGCQLRGSPDRVADEERAMDVGRTSAELDALRNENTALKGQLAAARDELSNQSGGTIGVTLTGLDGIEGLESTGDGGLALSDDVSFAKGSAELTSDGQRAIAAIAAKLNEADLAGTRIAVEGHTDQTPVSRASTREKFVDNLGLSAARAASVARALMAAGVAVDRVRPTFFGEHKPRASGTSKDDQARNRRVELRVSR